MPAGSLISVTSRRVAHCGLVTGGEGYLLGKTTSAKNSHYVSFSVQRSGLLCSVDLIFMLI